MVEYRTLGAFNPAAVKDLDRSIIDEAADDRIRGFQALAAHDREELKAAYSRIDELEAALKFYADPAAYQKALGRTNFENGWQQIPDFYSELDFGSSAREVLS